MQPLQQHFCNQLVATDRATGVTLTDTVPELFYKLQDQSARPIFADVRPGMTVIMRHDHQAGKTADKAGEMERMIHSVGGAHGPSMHNLVQIAAVDCSEICGGANRCYA
tara:strand:- start:368 stop:694 length:327 start_codon:yes stop_codon:yes gene_type:complete